MCIDEFEYRPIRKLKNTKKFFLGTVPFFNIILFFYFRARQKITDPMKNWETSEFVKTGKIDRDEHVSLCSDLTRNQIVPKF